MGAGIAGVFVRAGFDVALYSRGQATLETARTLLCDVANKVRFSTDIEECLDGAEIVSENIAENADLKRDLFALVESKVSATCLLTTNTSSVPISSIASSMRQPHRLVGLHWFNPPAVMPLVEIVRGKATSESVVEKAQALCNGLGKESIEVKNEIPGFVINRLQYAMLREALHLVEEGIASIQDVDRAVETTLAPRWSSAGPLRLMDMAGLDTVAKVSAVLMPALSRSEGVSPIIEKLVSSGALGTKAQRGFYNWSDEEISIAKMDRDETVKLLTERRKS
ncbi:3-hydroxyacyl-CoA dehydrogenase family protein [Ensifer adhaerens]|nr:3-hydroxyacyl-CoA dehydrogenase family protein [Ensifer adhaerens]UAY05059.1 3-hydroxyacyl-CoA dehydrogenase family protein [Ensifer adhaerens]UAY12480.1 3-hydroxyacyl-CoA dehydrogenase family protein [Ensifer adhaerens]